MALTAVSALSWPGSGPSAQGADPCAPPLGNAITCENALPGNPPSEWEVQGAGDDSIQGYATDISVNRGQTIRFKIDTNSTNYRIDIYRLGYYGGLGARRVDTIMPSATLPQNQDPCLNDFSTGLVDCGNWQVSASWTVPANATSGYYIARPRRADTGGASHIAFIVRQDNSTSDILFQAADTTWQAYNNYGGNSLYVGAPAGRAYKVSYNRPFVHRSTLDGYGQPNWIFWGEYPMIRFLESNGFDVSYMANVDTERRGAQILNHRVFLNAGHDEYWSAGMRNNLEAARNAGVHLAQFVGNYMYWKVRFEPSIDDSETAYRTLVCYKETLDGQKNDPTSIWTGTWRDPRFSPPSDGGRPENAIAGTIFTVNRGSNGLEGIPIEVPSAESRARLWRNTDVANQPTGQFAFLAHRTLGYEWDEDLNNGHRPPGLIRLSSTHEQVAEKLLQGYGAYEDFGPGEATHALTLYKHSSGSLVFSAGTVQWSWGLDGTHDGYPSIPNLSMRQATVNLLADMGVQPRTRQADLFAASASTDQAAPTATITYPTAGQQITPGLQVLVTGTAVDNGGGVVSAIEVSVNGGQTWQPAVGLENWSFAWTPMVAGSYSVRARAVDDSANIQPTPAAVTVSVAVDTQAPLITGRTPAPGSTNVSAGTAITATFNEPMSVASITASTIELRTPGNQLVPATVSYDVNTRTVTLQPNSTLAFTTTYTARVRGGSNGVKDFSNNPLAADSTWTFTTWSAPPCPCSIWDPSTTTPSIPDSGDSFPSELGVKFRADYDGTITGLRFYKSAANTGTHVGHLWRADGTLIATVNFTDETPSGWQEAYFASPVNISANTTYVASYYAPNGHYAFQSNYFASSAAVNAPLRAPAAGETPNGVFKGGASGFPNESYQSSNYWVDVIYLSTAGDVTSPTVTTRTPASGASAVSAGTLVTARFSEPVLPASLTTTTFEVRNAANQLVAGTVSYAAATRTATFRPNQTLAFQSTFTVRVRGGATGVQDLAGNDLVADDVWGFTTGAAPQCPCSIWDVLTAAPTVVASSDGNAGELGVRFRSEFDGYITGLRFYKGEGNTGTHTGHLWNANGDLLAAATFTNETATGWQEVVFDSPVPILAHTTYTASYFAPNGHYAFDAGYFNSNGVLRSPLSAPPTTDGGNGVFFPGAVGFPNMTFNGANYWVDVIYTSAAGDATPPTVTGQSPSPGAANVSPATNVTATFSEAMSGATITGTNVELRTSGGQLVPATVTYNGASRTAVLDPSATLVFGATYTARVKGGASGVADAFGNRLAADFTWTFTAGQGPTCPCNIWDASTVPTLVDAGDGSAGELGVKFRVDYDGVISGIRFYKSDANIGTHVGNLWRADGTLLATVTFTGESASGWQQANFSSPVPVNTDTVYVASYHAPNGHYSATVGYFNAPPASTSPVRPVANGVSANGVFKPGASGFPDQSFQASNYWVDVVYAASTAPDVVAPTVTGTLPINGSTGVSVGAGVVVRFSEAVATASLTAATFELRGPTNQVVPGAIAYNPSTLTATLQPSAALAFDSLYTVRIVGGAAGVTDLAGNGMVSDVTWSFTTQSPQSCPCSFWDPLTTVPGNPDFFEGVPVELGLRFRPQVDGFINGIRFYKGAGNIGTHTGTLWASNGSLMATGTFSGETATGWQTLTFANPVAVFAGTTYVASYFNPAGSYAIDPQYFGSALQRFPLVAPAMSDGGNGVFRSGSAGFPNQSFNAANYWVDVVFEPMPEFTLTTVAVTGRTTSGATITWTTSVPSDSQVDYGTTAAYGQTTPLDTAMTTSHSVVLSGLSNNTTYFFRVRSRDAASRVQQSAGSSFTTDVTAPTISGVASSGVTGTGATIAWTTNEAADTQVEYGTTTSYGSLSTLQPAFTTGHSVVLSGLTANQTYNYRVRSRDAAGNLTVSGNFTFNTDVAGPVVTNVQAVGTPNGATITWTTDENSNTQVDYGLTTSYGSSSTLQTALTLGHSVTLSGLQSNRTYNYRVRSRDAAGNLTVSGNFTVFTDATPPTISNIQETPTTNGAILAWTTNEPADTQVVWGTSQFNLNQSSPLQPALTTAHSVTLTGLSASTTYYYRVRSRDAAGNLEDSSTGSFRPDNTAPTISNVASTPGQTGATIRWDTNEDADSLVEYGLTTSYGSSSPLDATLTEDHTVVLSGLQPNTTYNYRVRSRDAAGNTRFSSNATFRTDNTAPTISNVQSSSVSGTRATISWTTNEASDTQIEYGTTSSLGSTSSLQTSMVTSHSQQLTGLSRNTTYFYRVRSRDAAGNLSVSSVSTFRTTNSFF